MTIESSPRGSTLMALDVSSSATGYAVADVCDFGVRVIDFGVIKPPSSWPSLRRIDWMRAVAAGIAGETGVSRVCMEWQSHKTTGRRVQGLAVLGQAQGVFYAHFSARYRVDMVSERDWTRIGGRNVRKDARTARIKELVPEYARLAADPKYDPGMDAADALGILFWAAGFKKGELIER